MVRKSLSELIAVHILNCLKELVELNPKEFYKVMKTIKEVIKEIE